MSYIYSLTPVLFCLFVTLILPRVTTALGTVFSVLLLIAYLGLYNIGRPGFEFRFETGLPLFILITGYTVAMTHRLLYSKREAKKAISDHSGSDRMLGLFYQQQGMLDLAFEKYRSIPFCDDIKGLVHDLAIEYETQGQIDKALDAYKWIAEGAGAKNEMMGPVRVPGETEYDSSPGLQKDGRPSDLFDVNIGSTIGHYTVSEETARALNSAVYKGRDQQNGTPVIIKVFSSLPIEDNERSAIRGRFFDDAECLRRMRHPNVVSLYDYGEEQDMLFILTEAIEGEEMKSHTGKDRLFPIMETLRIIGCAAEGLDYAHRTNMVHQCLRPASIIRMKDSREVKVKDFEIAMIRSLFQSEPDAFKDSHTYLSPEQVAGKKVDARSDIFSLGVILFEMLTGANPFSGGDMTEVMLKISKEKHPSPRFYNAKVPRVVERIIDNALEKDLEKRYQNAAQLAAHLNGVVTKINELMRKKKTLNENV